MCAGKKQFKPVYVCSGLCEQRQNSEKVPVRLLKSVSWGMGLGKMGWDRGMISFAFVLPFVVLCQLVTTKSSTFVF